MDWLLNATDWQAIRNAWKNWWNKPDPLDGTEKLLEQRAKLLDAHNQYRDKARLRTLREHPQLTAAAQQFADYMRKNNVFPANHEGPRGVTPSDRASSAGYTGLVGENIYLWANATPQQVTDGWYKSPGHKANMLGNYADVGFGVAGDRWVTVFGNPSKSFGTLPAMAVIDPLPEPLSQ